MKKPDQIINPMLDVVVPCYDEEAVLPETISQLRKMLAGLVASHVVSSNSRLVFVDDGSADSTWNIIYEAAESHGDVAGIRLARNAGQQNALLAGLENSTADIVLTVDADLQDDLGVVPEMIARALAGCDVVYGVRASRLTDSCFKRVSAENYYRLLNLMGVAAIANHAEFRLMRRAAIDRLKQFGESNLYLRGIVPMVSHRTACVRYDRLGRTAGKTKYSIWKMIALALDGITSLSAIPLRVIAALGFMVFVLSFLLGLWVFWVRFVAGTAVPGWASIVLPTFFLGGVQLLSLGVIGEYVAKIYQEAKRRPRYFIESTTRARREG